MAEHPAPDAGDPVHRVDAVSDIERELRAALAAEPSPAFVARVRERVAGEGRPAAAWWHWALAPAAATVVALATMGVLEWRGGTLEPTVPLTASAVAPGGRIVGTIRIGTGQARVDTDAPTALVASARSVRPATSARPDRGTGAGALRSARPELAVIISPGESAALRRLLADATRGRVEPGSPLTRPEAPALIEFPELVVQPIAIDIIEIQTIQTAGGLP